MLSLTLFCGNRKQGIEELKAQNVQLLHQIIEYKKEIEEFSKRSVLYGIHVFKAVN